MRQRVRISVCVRSFVLQLFVIGSISVSIGVWLKNSYVAATLGYAYGYNNIKEMVGRWL